MRNLLAAALTLLAVPVFAAEDWHQALRDFAVEMRDNPAARERWEKRAAEERRGRLAVSEDQAARWDFAGEEGALTMTLSRKTYERYAELYHRWQEDPSLKIKYQDNVGAYLGGVNGRVGAAMIDAIVTPLDRTSEVEALPLTGRLVHLLVETMKVAESIDSGNFDVYGSDVDDFFRDRFGRRSRSASGAMVATASKTRRRLRVHVSPRAELKDTKVGLIYSADPNYGPLDGWHAELGADTKLFRGGELVRAWAGISRPWPNR